MPVLDLGPAAGEMSALVERVPDERLGDATPCPGYRLGDLIEHVGGLALAFAAAAAKEGGPLTAVPVSRRQRAGGGPGPRPAR